MRRGFTLAVLILSTLVVVGVFVQVYLIGAYIFGAGTDALDAHKDLGGVVHIIEVLAFLAALPAYWGRWWDVGWAFALAAVGTAQLGFAEGEEWVGGLHAFFALLVLVIAAVVSHRAVRAAGLGRHGRMPGAL
jgi:asparagine N-glycosylation enzyme membrane subunit Stt3